MRSKYVLANFKMNKVNSQVKEYLEQFLPLVEKSSAKIVLAVPSVSVKCAAKHVKGSNVSIAGQNINENDFGAYTGEINAEMLADVGASYVLVGHSERRNIFGESNEVANKKIQKALKAGLGCIYCVGETLFDRKNKRTSQVLATQIAEGLKSIYANELQSIIIAYEPVWAIGTGLTPQDEEIVEAVSVIRKALAQMYDENIASEVAVVYGGSVTENNSKVLSKLDGVDGVLVGGASLDAEKFSKIVGAFTTKK